MAGEAAFRDYLDKWDRKYWATYKVLDILQKVFYRSNPAREAFVELCKDNYVQKMTFDSYLYKVRPHGVSTVPLKARTSRLHQNVGPGVAALIVAHQSCPRSCHHGLSPRQELELSRAWVDAGCDAP